jgi:hypothetical protein
VKKTRSRKPDDLRPEYDLRELGPGVRGKYYERAIAGPIVVELVPYAAKRAARKKKRATRKRPNTRR